MKRLAILILGVLAFAGCAFQAPPPKPPTSTNPPPATRPPVLGDACSIEYGGPLVCSK